MSPDHTTNRRRLTRALLLAVGAAAAAAPSPAAADSILYVDGGNVFSARPDGSGRVQLTDGGGWHSPTQADDGTFAAVQGTGPIQLFARDGRPLHTITTAEAKSGDGGTFAPRPVELSLSPDGSKLAYAYVAGSCPNGSTCGTVQRSTFYTETNVTTATPISVYGNQFGVHNPEWVSNTRTLVFGGHGSQVSIDDLGPGDYSQVPWMTPDTDMGDGEVSRDGRRLAVTFDYGVNTMLGFYEVVGDVRTELPPPLPLVACGSGKDEQLADPSWSPDGSAVAFHASSGIEVLRFASFGGGDCRSTGPSTTLTATGESPDWGPADPPAARWTPPAEPPRVDPPQQPRAGPRASPRGGGGTGPRVTLAVPRATTTAALRGGFAVKLTTSAPGSVSAKLSRGGRAVARGRATAKRAGAVTVRLGRLSAKAARRLRGRTLTLTVSASARGGGATTATRTLKVR